MTAAEGSSGDRPKESHPGRSSGGQPRRRRLLLAAALSAAILGVGASDAAALIVHSPSGKVSYMAVPGTPPHITAASGKKPVEYHGGPVMPSNTNYGLYWDPAEAPAYPAGYEAGIDRYFEDLAHDSGGVQNTDSVLVQYTDGAGEAAAYDSHFGGALTDTEPYPANGCSAAPICLTEAQIRTEITDYVQSHGLPEDLEHEYFVLTPPGVESCLSSNGKSCSDGTAHPFYCAYHGYIQAAGGVIVFANNPYVAGLGCDPGEEFPNDNPSDATIAGGLAHEHSESVTDPELNAWYDSKEQEVADKCRTFKPATEFGEPLGKAPDGANYNQVIDGELYWYQQEWSNEAKGCEQRSLAAPVVAKLAPKSGPATGGTEVTVTGSHFATAATVRFGEVAATEVLVSSSTTLTALSPAGGPGTVDVTVTTAAGTSAVTSKDHFKYKATKK